MVFHRSFTPQLALLLSVLCLPRPSAGGEIAAIPASQCDDYYQKTWKAKTRVDTDVDYAFIDGVPAIAKVRSASALDQCIGSIALFAIRREMGAVAMAYLSDMRTLKKSDDGKYKEVPQELFMKHVGLERGIDMQTDEDAEDNDDAPQTPPHPRSGAEGQWAGIKVLVPDIDTLGKSAGYEDISHDATPGLAMCLHVASVCKGKTDDIHTLLKPRFMNCEVHAIEDCSWLTVTCSLRSNTPLIAHAPSGKSWLIVGFGEFENDDKILFGYDPARLQRGVFYGGREMIESKLESFKAKNPQPDWARPRYFDFRSTHKQYQIPGFIALRYSAELKFTYVDEVEVDVAAIRDLNRRAMKAALAEFNAQTPSGK